MSSTLISRSPDLAKLKEDGYEIEVRSGHLLLHNIPYVNARGEAKRGTLVSTLTLAGDKSAAPDTHVAYFAGDYPCDKAGRELGKLRHSSGRQNLGDGILVDHSFSSKPPGGYADYHQKMETYASLISGHAEALDPDVTARTWRVIPAEADESVFNYIDTASSRAGIAAVSAKLALTTLGIVGLGGTGSYILDLVAKTSVQEIHLFDGDRLLTHNAFRAPGAASIEQLREVPFKVDYYRDAYSRMRRNIIAHPFHITPDNVDCLREMTFVFLCLDGGWIKRSLIEKMEEAGIPFIDTGMGIELVDGCLLGVLRVTTSTDAKRDHVREKRRIPLSAGEPDNDYDQNIQVADLNALNAALAVVRWKKLCGFYADFENEHFSAYTIDGNHLINEDRV